jgi:uncharacterized membrane protein
MSLAERSRSALPNIGWTGRIPWGGAAAFGVAVLLLAGVVHICAILLVPFVARSDGWSRLVQVAGEDQFREVPVDGAGNAGLTGLDPLFITGACRLDLREAPAGIALQSRERFWSIGIYDPTGTIVFSLNDRTATDGRLDMMVVNAQQNVALKRARPPEFEQMIVVESHTDDAIALLRLFAPTPSVQAEARQILSQAECLAAPLPQPGRPSGG